jgi:predicted ATPase
LFWRGEFPAAQAHLEQGATLYDPQLHHAKTFLYADDPGVACGAVLAFTLWLRGYPDQALPKIHNTLQLAQDLSDFYSQAFTLFFAAGIHQYRREWRSAQRYADTAMTLASEQGFPLWEAGAMVMRGWALAEEGRTEEGLMHLRQGLAAWQATGAKLGQPYVLALIAEALGKGGQVDEGLEVLSTIVPAHELRSEQRECEAEVYRIKGVLLHRSTGRRPQLKNRHVVEAEKYFRRAIEVARRQSAKSFELRAVMSLSRLWQEQGKRAEARQLLTEVYSWFTEGFDTADLKEAKALLDELT